MKHTDSGEHTKKKPPVPHKGHRRNPETFRIGDTMGTSSGETEFSTVSGGWAGTDDATSTAPSDQMGNPPVPEADKLYRVIEHDFNETVDKDEGRLS